MGCDQVQGFFISRPAPAEEVSTFFDPQWNLWETIAS
jgi:EAL domain-containing protein (putative c-di-GMP-specific phosphodiesterase class I)